MMDSWWTFSSKLYSIHHVTCWTCYVWFLLPRNGRRFDSFLFFAKGPILLWSTGRFLLAAFPPCNKREEEKKKKMMTAVASVHSSVIDHQEKKKGIVSAVLSFGTKTSFYSSFLPAVKQSAASNFQRTGFHINTFSSFFSFHFTVHHNNRIRLNF